MAKHTPISEVEPTYSNTTVKGLYNPYQEDFVFSFAGKELVAKADSVTLFPEPVAAHAAKHLAYKIMNGTVNSFLLKHFPGFDEQGREKWRTNTKQYVRLEDIEKLKKQLLVESSEVSREEHAKIEVPTSEAENKTFSDEVPTNIDVPDVEPDKEEEKLNVSTDVSPDADNVATSLDLGAKRQDARVTRTRTRSGGKSRADV